MAKTKKTAGKIKGGRAPKKELAKKAARKVAKEGPRPHVYRRSLRAYRQIRDFQRTTKVLTNRAAWIRCIKSAMDELPNRTYKTLMRIKKAVASIIHELAEAFIVKLLTDAVDAMAHAKRVATTPKDLHLSIRLRDYKDNVLFGWKPLNPGN